MATLESLNELLREAARLLDKAAEEIRDSPLKPIRSNIEHTGKALAEVFELQLQIDALRPDLSPQFMKGPSKDPTKALELLLRRSHFFEEAGEPATSVALLEFFVADQVSEQHIAQARSEISRLTATYGI